jgi:exonuclease III
MYYSGGEKSERGVAIVVHKSIVGSVVKIMCNDRLIVVKLNAEPVNVLIVQVYMPMSDYEDEEVEELYDRIEDILEEDGKGDTNTIIMGDWNSSVGDKSNDNICGPYGLGNRNTTGQMLIDFLERTGLVISNTWFNNPKRRLYTWKARGDQHRYKLDYILVKQQYRNSVKDVQTQPGADIDSDHNLLVTKICTGPKRIVRLQKRKPVWDLENLRTQRQKVQESLEEKLHAGDCVNRNV